MKNTTGNAIEKLHATCVAVGSRGVLILGKSGSGKSDLALRLISKGATLVADDQTVLREEGGYLLANVDDSIRGLLVIRGVGLVRYPIAHDIPLVLVVQLVPREEIQHIPQSQHFSALGVSVPYIALHGLDASAPEKVLAALYALHQNALHTGFLPDAP